MSLSDVKSITILSFFKLHLDRLRNFF